MPERISDVSAMVAERAADWSEEHGRVSVRRRRFGHIRAALLRLFGIPAVLTVHLDPLGSEVWLLLDGVRTVDEVRRELERTRPDETDLGPRLGKFIGAMVSRRLVILRTPR
ncbi:MAG: PqqD family protein [Thermoplasmatota archaeon]|nr:PqqD family protein [Halobacteriales archaeon]